MKIEARFTFLISAFLLVLTCSVSGEEKIEWRWRDARELRIEGKGWQETKSFYDRLPAKAEKMVRPAVWSLSHDSAGMCVRFISDATAISARWALRKDSLAMLHMPASGVSGVDLYTREKGKWQWVGAARPKQVTNEVVVVKGLEGKKCEFILYLPLYNGVNSVEIGVPIGAKLEAAPITKNVKPCLFYGTSILHGGCASRPGMAYPAILGRKLDWPVINLGFSGNAWSEPEMAQLLSELDPAIYVLDPLPNMTADGVKERMEPFIRTIREKHPKTPIVLVEAIEYTDSHFVQSRRERFSTSNAALRAVYERLKKLDKNLHYIPCDGLVGSDGEGTVDGTHPTDLGFMRMAEKMEPILRKWVK